SSRSFQGLVCLMQLSTREKDYIIDPLALRKEMWRLLPIFTDPNIVKVFHGSDSDVLWLQRDLGLYLVNMFDTGQASRQLGLPSFSLAHLLLEFCQFTVDKKHQLSDWRIRPLPSDMLRYAQTDTHYLLYLYDRLRCELEQRGGDVAVKGVLDASREICLRRYEKPVFSPGGWAKMLRRQGDNALEQLDPANRRVFAALWDWRDQTARSADESVGYVMSVYVMMRIARRLPANSDELASCGNPLPPLVQKRMEEVLRIVKEAKEAPTEAPGKAPPSNPESSDPSSANGANGPRTPAANGSRMSSTVGGSLPASSSRLFNPVSSPEPYFRAFNVTPSSASQYVLAESRGSPSPHLVHQSPVLNTEELYRAAGWTTPLPPEGVGRSSGAVSSSSGLSEGAAGEDDQAPPGDAPLGPSRFAVVDASNEMYNTSRRMPHSLSLGEHPGAIGGGLLGAGDGDGAKGAWSGGSKRAERIRDEIAREPVLSLANVAGFVGEPGEDDGDDGDGQSEDGAGLGGGEGETGGGD
ncbi:unnamed protein product, partial [Discosporangium mesarthrocarpum]